jgi:hypothetical protein
MLNDRFMTALFDLSGHRSLDTAADIVVKAAAIMAFLFLLAGYMLLPTLPVFGHDEAHYYPSFYFKLIEDGRWVNYLLHDVLRSVPLPLWSILYLALAWLLFYRLARAYAFDVAYAALIASTIVVAYPFLEISLWPATVVPALLLGLLAVELQARKVAYQIIYLVSGILIFGSMQTLYFVLPLLFLPQFLESSQPARARWQLLFSHMCWWVAGSVAGVLALCLILWLHSGYYFPQPAEWRNTHAVVDLASLLENIRYVIASFFSLMAALVQLAGVGWGYMLVVGGLVLLRSRTALAHVQAVLLMFAVLISFFLFSVPLAPVILPRSLIAMVAVVVLFIAFLPGRTAPGRMLGAVLLLMLSHAFMLQCQDYLQRHKAETTAFLEKFQQLYPGYPQDYGVVALYGTMDPAQPEARRFNDPFVLHPLLITLGAHTYLDCRIVPSRCGPVGVAGEPINVIPFAKGQLEFAVDAANVGIFRYRE